MPFINMKLGEVQEPKPAPAGRYELLITEAKYRDAKPSEDKGAGVKCSIAIVDQPTAPNVQHYISIPKPNDENAVFKQLQIKRFLAQFNIPYNEDGWNPDDLNGARANGELVLSEPDKETGAIYNRLKLDKLHDEPKD